MIAVLVMILACAAMLTGCNSSVVSDIVVLNSGKPRTVYVEGQDLDLSGGVITAIVDGEETSIPMNSEDVTVTGYDKDTIGKQTLTITYKEKTTTIEVNVIARMVAENFETNYFVGDKLDTSKGRLRIARDNATTFTVNLSDSTVTVKSFDSSKSGAATVTVGYKGSAGEDYEADFSVNVYDVGEVVFTKPYKDDYSSHDTELDFSGGYFTIKASGNSSFSKFVYLNSELVKVSGFKPEDVTIENRDTPADQTVVFEYAGKTYKFPITVVYSSISIVKQRIEELADLDWSKDEVTIDEGHGLAALDAIKEYYKLTNAEKKSLSEDEINTIVRPAAVYINDMYIKELETYSGSFGITSDGYFTLYAESYDAVETDRDRLKDPNEKINTYGDILRDIYADFAKTVIANKITIADYVFVLSAESNDYLIAILDQALKVYDAFSVIPDDWTVEDLSTTEYASAITKEVARITASEFIGLGYAAIYQRASAWRTNDDIIDIIYSYYMYAVEDPKTAVEGTLWNKLPMPGKLQSWYEELYNASYDVQTCWNYASTGEAYLYDTVTLFDAYYKSQVYAAEIKSGEDKLALDVYNIIEGDDIFNENIKKALLGYDENDSPVYGFGYIYHAGEGLDSATLEQMWKTYLALYDLYLLGIEDPKANEKEFVAAFNALAELSPAEVHAFLCSMHFQYDSSNGNILVLDYSNSARSTFVYLIANYYLECLPEAADPLFQKMLLAIENLSLINFKASALDDFKTVMGELTTAYDDLSDEDEAIFNQYVGECYNKYVSIYNVINGTAEVTAPSSFEELYNTLCAFDKVNEFFTSTEEGLDKDGVHALVFALYEKAKVLYGNVVAAGETDAAALLALYTKEYEFGEKSMTLDRKFYDVSGTFAGYMMYSTITSTDDAGNKTLYMAWEIYEVSGIDAFLADAAYLMMTDFDGTYTTDKDTVLRLMQAFRALNSADQNTFFTFDVDVLYYSAIEKFLATVLTEQELALAKAIFEAEAAYVMIAEDAENTEAIEKFKTEMSEATALLVPTESFEEYLSDIYYYYYDKYSALNEAE